MRRLSFTAEARRLRGKKRNTHLMEKEQWKDEVLRSLEGARRAEPSPLLYDKIRGKIGHAVKMRVVRPGYLALAAACLGLLVTANVWALRQSRQDVTTPSAYQLDYANFDLYE